MHPSSIWPYLIFIVCLDVMKHVTIFQAFPINGEVDSIHLNKVFLNAREKNGIKFIAELIGEKQIPFHDKKRFPNKLDFDCGIFGKQLAPEALVHAVQDCRLPLAGLGLVVERYCRAFHIPDHRNVLPLIHHILTRYDFINLFLLIVYLKR